MHPPPGTGMVGARQPLVLLARCPPFPAWPALPRRGAVSNSRKVLGWGWGKDGECSLRDPSAPLQSSL